MACWRCGGLLVQEYHFDILELSALEPVECQRCLNRRAVEDTVIRANRNHLSFPRRMRAPRGPRPLSATEKTMEPGATGSEPPHEETSVASGAGTFASRQGRACT